MLSLSSAQFAGRTRSPRSKSVVAKAASKIAFSKYQGLGNDFILVRTSSLS